jgi:hypothetical protein
MAGVASLGDGVGEESSKSTSQFASPAAWVLSALSRLAVITTQLLLLLPVLLLLSLLTVVATRWLVGLPRQAPACSVACRALTSRAQARQRGAPAAL